MKKLYLDYALSRIPRLLGSVDRNKLSNTYGCFDRNFWHYRVTDICGGIYQCGVLPLAIIYKHKLPGNQFYNQNRIKELVYAGIKYTSQILNKEGCADEYYPYERAYGTTAFLLYAFTESMILFEDKKFNSLFEKMAKWLIKNEDSGKIANHLAVSSMALFNVSILTKKEIYKEESKKRIKEMLTLQSDEGWFLEYHGCDAGYLTLSINFLAKYYQKTKDENVIPYLNKAIEFSSNFIHPDGSYGGEYGSRGTYHFFPDGFEICGQFNQLSTQISDQYLQGLQNKKNLFNDDDRGMHHIVYDYLQAYLNFNENRTDKLIRKDFERYYPQAKLYIAQKGNYYFITAINKGGVFKLFNKNKLIYSDAGLIAKNKHILMSQIVNNNPVEINETIKIKGSFSTVSNPILDTKKFIAFRILLLTLFRFQTLSKILKQILTKKLILKNSKYPLYFSREFKLTKEGLEIKDSIKGKVKLNKLYIGSDHTGIYVASSRYYQESVLKEWIELDVGKFNKEEKLEFERVLK